MKTDQVYAIAALVPLPYLTLALRKMYGIARSNPVITASRDDREILGVLLMNGALAWAFYAAVLCAVVALIRLAVWGVL